jgi:serine/threonine protein kinase
LTREDSGYPLIENIEIIELLAGGGMSLVYKARQMILDRIVAVKVLSGLSIRTQEGIRRFQNEAKLSSSLDHPNIVKTLAFGLCKDGQPYLVMDYLEGASLAEELKANGRLTLEKFRDVFIPVLSALSLAHQAGLVHRDIKPGNIMLCRGDGGKLIPRLVDFGIAKMIAEGSGESQKLTKTGTVLGSPAYMSPEQCLGKEVDGRSDIYAIACVMYECLCGEPPFSGDSALEVMNFHVSAPPPSRADLCRRLELDGELAAAVVSGLARDPSARPESACAFAGRLARILDSLTLDRVPKLKSSESSLSGKLIASLLLAAILAAGACLWGLNLVGRNKIRSVLQESNRLFTEGSPDHLIKAGEGLVSRGLPEKALAKYEQAINILTARGHRESSQIEAYMHAAVCAYHMAAPQGKLPGAANSHSAPQQGFWYSDRAIELAGQSKDRDARGGEVFLETCRQRIQDLHECSVPRLLALIEAADGFFGKGDWRALVVRKMSIVNLLSGPLPRELEGLLISSMDQAEEKYGTEHQIYLGMRSCYARLRAVQGHFSEANLLCDEVGMGAIKSRHASVDPGVRVGDILCGQILPALKHTKNAALAQRLVESELAGNLEADKSKPWLIGALYMGLADIKEVCGQAKEALSLYERALPYTLSEVSQASRLACLKGLIRHCRQQKLEGKVKNYELKLAELVGQK